MVSIYLPVMQTLKRYHDLLEAIEEEKRSERAFFSQLSKEKTLQEKIESGISMYPLSISKIFYTVGELVEVVFPKNNEQKSNRFKVGVGCKIYSLHNEKGFPATISFVSRKEIRIILKNDDIFESDLNGHHQLILEIIYDERPYTVMQNALRSLLKTKNERIKYLRDHLTIDEDLPYNTKRNSITFHNDNLNDEQNQAVSGCLNADYLGIIHGPPGTGKTTTLVALITHLRSIEKKLLVCAPSNNAVDLLATRLYKQGVKVLRVGNITRISDHITNLTLDEKLRNHQEWSRIKKVKIEAEESKKLALSYKRKFGAEEFKERKRMLYESRELKRWARDLEQRLIDQIVDEAEVICTTLIGCESNLIKNIQYNTLVIDEASQAMEPECWVAMQKAERTILAGDHKQLPPTVKSEKAEKLGLSVTILDHMSDTLKTAFLLRCQYRMNDDILRFPNQQFYDGKLYSDPSVRNRRLTAGAQTLVFIDTAGCGFDEEINYKNMSLKNPGEYFILREHLLKTKERLLGHSIGIISPYSEQVKMMRSNLQEEEELLPLDIEIDSIDGFQGQEKEVIYISLVRSNSQGQIGFLSDQRRLNVAITRAMKKLVIIGDSSTIAQHEIFAQLIDNVEKNGLYHSAWEYLSY